MADIERKDFTTRRVEHWVPCDYRTGACWTELMKAISWATTELRALGLADSNEPASDLITIHPHDEHVIVRFEVDQETTLYAEEHPDA